ncbi:helix-turn-helix transcriptional regulator [uncultured Flavonifractor sp.]|uniref:helix-turn-helix transcriptional regulator n=1 Tax=uncultured Flavonifractor sp. TaxID=1193534 RepID=UPI003413DCC2
MRLKELRESRGMTQQDVAEAIHVTKGAVCQWENGTRIPGLSTALMLADLFRVPLDTLLGRATPEEIERDAS